MSSRLVGRPSVAAVEQLVRSVLDDPLAQLLFWLPRREHFVDRLGNAVVLSPEDAGKTWRTFGHGGTRVLAIVHDPISSEDPELVEAVGVAATARTREPPSHHDLSTPSARFARRNGGSSQPRRPSGGRSSVTSTTVCSRSSSRCGFISSSRLGRRERLDVRLGRARRRVRRGVGRPSLRCARHLSAGARRRWARARPSTRPRAGRPCRSRVRSRTLVASPRIARPPSTTAASRRCRTSPSTPATTPLRRCGSGGSGARCISR